MKGRTFVRIGKRAVDKGVGWLEGQMDRRRKKWKNVK
jgi:hypothetical protein